MSFPLALVALIAVDKLLLSPRASEDRRRRRSKRVRVRRIRPRVRPAPTPEPQLIEETMPAQPAQPVSQAAPSTTSVPEEEFALSQTPEVTSPERLNVEAAPYIESEAEGFTFSE